MTIQQITLLFILSFSCFITQASAVFDATGNSNLVMYWGQASAGSQERLGYYCEEGKADMIVLSFMTAFPGTNDIPSLNFASACVGTEYDNGLLHCSEIAEDIKTCQSSGVKILLSLGGASGAYGFTTGSEATEFADSLWNLFLEGDSDTKPFDDAIIDGFDLDIEDNNSEGYTALVTELRSKFSKGTKDYYISAAPQCPNPDESLNNVMTSAEIDFAFIQFYNNYCQLGGSYFNYDTWEEWAKSSAYNKDIKLYLGVPGSYSAASSGYTDISTLKSAIESVSCSSNFGGVSVWDASQADANEVSGGTWAAYVRDVLDNDICASGVNSSIPSTSSSSASASFSTTLSTIMFSSSASSSFVTTITPTVISSSVITTTIEPISSSAKLLSTTTVNPAAYSSLNAPDSLSTSYSTYYSTSTSYSTFTSTFTSTSVSTTYVAYSPSSNASIPTPTSMAFDVAVFANSTASKSTANITSYSTSYSTHYSTLTSYSTSTSTFISTSISTTYIASSTEVDTETSSSSSSPASSTTTSSTSSSTASSTINSSTSSSTASAEARDCSSLSGLERAKCMNALYKLDSYYLRDAQECTDGAIICRASGELAICDNGTYVSIECPSGTTCYASNDGDYVIVTCNFSSYKSAFLY
ncbi:chitinase [Saccharomycopsis crataegensis]|uniref:chitinase n=1 Tax=Saccharomycopsis crataegensis TaxID=43959 RepID=A0AAV5QKF5_9ASCO|nr:chitinase [Saccharomycopsis crataegensis]